GGLLNNIISSLKSFSSSGNNGGNGNGNINTAYQMLTDASDGKLGTYANNAYQTCTNGANGNSSNCYTPSKTQNATAATNNATTTTTDSNL
ncbi:hypothetical protein EC518_14650, partial [Helicobacter pylori]